MGRAGANLAQKSLQERLDRLNELVRNRVYTEQEADELRPGLLLSEIDYTQKLAILLAMRDAGKLDPRILLDAAAVVKERCSK